LLATQMTDAEFDANPSTSINESHFFLTLGF